MLKSISTKILFVGTCVCLLFLAACAFAQPAAPTHQVYAFHGPNTYTAPLHSGDLIQLDWKPKAVKTTTDPAPDAVLLTAKLIGPFSSVNEMNAAVVASKSSHDTFPPHLIAAAAADILTDTWNSTSRSSVLGVPGKLPAGYYDLFYASFLTSGGKIQTDRTDVPVQIK